MRIWIAIILAPLLLLAGCGKIKEKLMGMGEKEADKKLRTVEVQEGDFRISISATGKVTALRKVDVSSKASGQIIELPYETGTSVKKGELLARIDPVDEERNVARSEASLRSAKAQLDKARSELEIARSNLSRTTTDAASSVKVSAAKQTEAEARHARQQQLFERNLLPKEEIEASNTMLTQARGDLERAQAALEETKSLKHQISAREQDIKLGEVQVSNAEISLAEARKRLADTEIRAAMDGIITERKVEVGQVISSAMTNVSGGTMLMVVSDLSSLHLLTSVDETDIGGIQVGQSARITTDAFPGETFEGRVIHIAPVGVELKSVVTFDVKVEVVGEGLRKLKPGMTASVTIIQHESPGTHWAQSEAVQEKDGRKFVEVLVDEKLKTTRTVDVETGLTDGLRTELKGDLKAGERLVIREKEGLSEWAKGGGGKRPMREIGNPFRKKDKDEEKKKAEEKKEADKQAAAKQADAKSATAEKKAPARPAKD